MEKTLADKLRDAQGKIEIGDVYYHYRNPTNTYTVTDIVLNEVDHRILIIYAANYNEKLRWARDMDIWNEYVEHDGVLMPRFTKINK